ncbi:hypothetical protein E4U53_006281, partial [Claviceps sorghi]
MMKAAEKEGSSPRGTTASIQLKAKFLPHAKPLIFTRRDPLFYQRFQGRNDLLDYAAEKGIPVTSTKAKP